MDPPKSNYGPRIGLGLWYSVCAYVDGEPGDLGDIKLFILCFGLFVHFCGSPRFRDCLCLEGGCFELIEKGNKEGSVFFILLLKFI